MKQLIKILSTKKISSDLVQQAKANNILIDEMSFIETKPVINSSLSEKIKQYFKEQITAIFTSANAVEAVFGQINFIPDWKIFCIEGATKEALTRYVNEGLIIGAATNASVLAEEILKDGQISSCVFFCGNQRLNSLPDKLLKHKIELEEIIVYETISAPQKVNDSYNGILFFSPSAVESFFYINSIGDADILFSVGKTTTRTLRKYTDNKIITATFPGAESVLKEVKNFYLET